jgi:TonB family protein
MTEAMIETVSDILVARSRDRDGLSWMVIASIAAHVMALTALAFAPKPDFSRDAPRTVMTISLGGAPGPRSGGMTPMGGRAIQEAAPPDAPKPRAELPPAPTAPEMTVPVPTAKPRPPQPRPQQAPAESTGRARSTGAEVREGSARAETGGRGQGFGLTTGGGGGTGAQLDVGDFCCPDYIETVVQRIHQNWASKQNVSGRVVVKFTIQRDGALSQVQVFEPSGLVALDMAAHRAVLLTQRVPPLPAQFSNATLTVRLTFDYQR